MPEVEERTEEEGKRKGERGGRGGGKILSLGDPLIREVLR